MGCLDFNGVQKDVPNALARLSENLDAWNYDSSGLRPGLDVIGEMRSIFTQEIMEDSDELKLKQIRVGEERVRNVQFLSLAVFRRLLVNHFAILFRKNKIVWPKSQKKQRRN